jgi:hypothetical protein
MDGWPSQTLFNYDYQIINLSDREFEFIQACDQNKTQNRTIGQILTEITLDLATVRTMQKQGLIILTKC